MHPIRLIGNMPQIQMCKNIWNNTQNMQYKLGKGSHHRKQQKTINWTDSSPYHNLHEDTQNPSPLYE